MDGDSAPNPGQDTETTRLLQGAHDYILTLPPQERHIAMMAANGASVWEIAQQMRVSDAAVAGATDSSRCFPVARASRNRRAWR